VQMAMQQVGEKAEQLATSIAEQQAAQQTTEHAKQKATDQAEQKAALQPTTSNPSATMKAHQTQERSSFGILRYLDDNSNDDADPPPLPTGSHKPAAHTEPLGPERSAMSSAAQNPNASRHRSVRCRANHTHPPRGCEIPSTPQRAPWHPAPSEP
jgi:hypothetical protein